MKEDLEKINSFTNNQVIRLAVFLVISTATVTGLVDRFAFDEQKMEIVEERLDKKIKIINALNDEVDDLHDRVMILELKECK